MIWRESVNTNERVKEKRTLNVEWKKRLENERDIILVKMFDSGGVCMYEEKQKERAMFIIKGK